MDRLRNDQLRSDFEVQPILEFIELRKGRDVYQKERGLDMLDRRDTAWNEAKATARHKKRWCKFVYK